MRSNAARLAALPGREWVFDARDFVGPARTEVTDGRKAAADKALFEDMSAVERLVLKKNAQVMLLKNQAGSDSLANGSVGIVVAFATPTAFNQFLLDERLEDTMQCGPPWWEGILAEYAEDPGADDPGTSQPPETFPVVRFAEGRAADVHYLLARPKEWRVVDHEGRTRVSRRQVPLVPAWAISIHKSQGLSFEKLMVDLNGMFTFGQAYVALSRARSLDGLYVRNVSRQSILTDPRVVTYYAELELRNAETQRELERLVRAGSLPNAVAKALRRPSAPAATRTQRRAASSDIRSYMSNKRQKVEETGRGTGYKDEETCESETGR
jgi:ATP-dependent DNA helicase PIF1